MSNFEKILKSKDSERAWLREFYNKIIANNENNFVHDSVEEEEKYECISCSKIFAKSDLKICSCGSKKFASCSLLDDVIDNTINFSKNSSTRIDKIFHKAGKIYIKASGELGDLGRWNSKIKACGKFKRNDVIIFDLNEDNTSALVASVYSDKIVSNEECEVDWKADVSKIAENIEKIESFADSRNRKINAGDMLEWYIKSGPIRGVFQKISNGKALLKMAHDEFGPIKGKEIYREFNLDENFIMTNGVIKI